jgi:plasmid maintenance system antidote protein VapI
MGDGKPIPANQLKTYAQALAQYHLRPETKFENGDYCDSGPTRRRHVQATQVNYIGKEANRWEEQFFLGMDEDAAIEYGANPRAALFDELRHAMSKFGKQQLASWIGVSRNSLTKILAMKWQNLSPRISQKIGSAITAFNSHSLDEGNKNSNLLSLAWGEVAKIGLSEFARRLQIDVSNLSKVADGKRKLSPQLAARFERYFNGDVAVNQCEISHRHMVSFACLNSSQAICDAQTEAPK